MNSNLPNFVVTIGRQFGSGGREIGKLVAQELGISYFDKELLDEAAKSHGVNANLFENADERVPRFFSSFGSMGLGLSGGAFFTGSSGGSDALYKAQSQVIEEIASRGSCVIVGRTADYILRNRENVISVFIHAPIESCVKRILERNETATEDQARILAEKKNKLRSAYYNFYTERTWGDAATYDLCIDSSSIPVEAVAKIIVAYVRARLNIN